jgi:hypothetical protein
MKFPRNSPCPCGSGKKYKNCHLGKPFNAGRDLSLHGRNLILLNAARDIFGFGDGRSWVDIKKNISGEQIRELYLVQARLWSPGTDWTALMPSPGDGTLRALYLGDIRPELVLRNIIRFSLYSDTIFVIDPFVNPHIVRPKYNPIENPNKHRTDVLKPIYFLSSVAPWIESGMLYLIPDPGDLNLDLKWETIHLARERVGDKQVDERDLEDTRAHHLAQMMRALYALPEEKMLSFLRRAGVTLTEEQEKEFVAHARHQLRSDPIALEQSLDKEGQLVPLRGGANLETALLICSMMDAFPYTNMHTVWRWIIEAHDQLSETARMWSPFTKAFQALDFRFLNNVDPEFAQRIRDEGRLEGFRAMLRRIGNGATNVTSVSSLDSFVRNCNDDLKGEYQKAQAEWSKINESLYTWGAGGVGVAAAAIATGHFIPSIATLSAGTAATVSQLGLRYFRQQQFRKANPMSIMIDLSRKKL